MYIVLSRTCLKQALQKVIFPNIFYTFVCFVNLMYNNFMGHGSSDLDFFFKATTAELSVQVIYVRLRDNHAHCGIIILIWRISAKA